MSSTQTVAYCTLCDGWVWIDGDGENRTLGDHPDAKGIPCQNAGNKPTTFGTVAIAAPVATQTESDLGLTVQFADPPRP